DDIWLASTAPDFITDPTQPQWSQVSVLNPIGVRIPRAGGAYATPNSTNGGEYSLDNTTLVDGTPRRNNNLIITGVASGAAMDYTHPNWEPYGVDADDDGVLDSLWTWATIPQISGVSYVMAVRIVDNSALLNLNSATVLHSGGEANLAGMPAGA